MSITESLSLAKREIPWAPGFNIDKDGVVRRGSQRVPTTTVLSRKGVQLLAVDLSDLAGYEVVEKGAGYIVGGRPVAVSKILSSVWYDGKLILPRNGSGLNWMADNVIVLSGVTETTGGTIVDSDEILLIWVTYCREACSCWQLAEKTGLSYSRDQFWSLIRDIVVAGIR